MTNTTEVTTEDIMYNAGVNDAAIQIITGEIVYTGLAGELTTDEMFAYYDGHTWAWNHREEVVLP